MKKMLPYFTLRGRGRIWKILLFICLINILHLFLWTNSWRKSSEKGIISKILGSSYCKPVKNVVYIKEFKCASTTLANMFRRYGLENDLSFVLPRQQRIYLGWPYMIQEGFYRPSKTGEYNILCDHVVYNKDALSSIMPENTVYVTSLREPYSQFKSMFNYYNVAKIAGIPGNSTMSTYLRTLPKYDTIYKSPNSSKIRYCVPDGFSISKNLMSYCLGFQTGFPEGAPDWTNAGDQILNFIQTIDYGFHLVMIVEYFNESLILLKRLMCWGFKDIVYQAENVGSYNYRHDQNTENVAIYKNWSYVDHILYDHFKEELIKRIEDQRDDFIGEVNLFKEVNSKVSQFCSSISGKQSASSLVIEASRWSPRFQINQEFCQLMADEQLLKVVKEKYDKIPVIWEDEVPNKKFC